MAKIIADCTVVLLCGGKSSRMGFDKALLKIQGQYVILQTAEKLMELFEEVILVTNDSQKFPKAFRKCTIIQDMYLGKGPLGGIVTAMNYTQKAEVFVIACDIPTFSPKLVYQLASKRGQNQVTIFDFEGRQEPLFGFYRCSCLPTFQKQLAQNNYQVRQEFERLSVKTVQLSKENQLKNVNRKEELSQWSR
ncbi:TPA: molybdenum cofactor guanylyltransferase [Enterococcus faecalis]|nr:molybdenum cofactor guanylyltransferase [Enterococcus faecalis]